MRRSKMKIMVILLTAAMLWNGIIGGSLGSGKAFAANEFSGSGTSSSPYLIGTADQLNQIRGSYLNRNLYFKLTNPIDLKTSSYKDNWTPIGDRSNAPFRGNFDGNGFVISGLTIDMLSNNLGLFGNTSIESVIHNVKLEDVNVTGLKSVGGLVGANRGKITNSSVTGQVKGTDYIGGLVGHNGVTVFNANAIIEHSFAVVDVKGAYGTGGLTGSSTGTITSSYATGNVEGDYAVGGLAGENDGSISYSYATGELLDGQSVGGLVGSNVGAITSSFATGRVNGTYSTGGLTGYNYGTISKSYSTGDVYGEQHVGGLVSNLEIAGSISDSFTTGNVSGSYFVGGLIGYDYANSTGAYTNSYASGNVSGIAYVGDLSSWNLGNNVGSLYLDASMKGPVAGWDFVNLWAVDPLRNNGYPYLKDFLFQLQYDGNGNTGGTVPSDATSYFPGETASVYAGPIDLTRTGYTFSGWNTQPNGHGNSYSGSFQIMPYTTLYAQWDAQSSAATLTSGIGIVSVGGTANETITHIPYGTSLAAFKQEIRPATNATFEIYDADGTTVATTLTSGKKVIVTAADGMTKVTYTVTVIANNEKDITAFSFAEQTGAATISRASHTVVVEVTGDTDVTSLKAVFTLSDGAAASVGSVVQVSETTANDFTNAVTYMVTAEDGSTQNWTVTVTKSSEKDITAFAVIGVTQTKAAVINTMDQTVYVEVAYGTSLSSLSNLKAMFSLSPGATAQIGNVVQVSGATANDMRTPVPYIVTAADGSSQEWIVSVYIEPSSAKDITAFSFASQTKPATINAAARTVDIEVSSGTNVANLVAAFTLSLSSTARVNGLSQRSGITSNNFTNPVMYVVKAADGSTQSWTVTVSVQTVLSSDATLTSAIGTVSLGGTANETIKNIPYGTTLAVLKAAITPAVNATFEVYESDGVTAATTLVTGAKVIVTAEDRTTMVTYTVTVNSAPPSGGGGPIIPTDTKVSSTDGRLTIPTGYTGEMSLDNAIIVTVPADAADKELIITIERVTDTVKLLANNEVLVTAIYDVIKNIPEDLHRAATVTFTFDPASLKSNQRAAIFSYDETKKRWIEITGGQINGNHISVKVNHFTKFAVLAVSQSTDVPADPTVKWSDIAGHWAESSIMQAWRNGIVAGYPDGTFKPNHPVTREEFTVMLIKALKSQEATGEAAVLAFTDAAKIGTWAKNEIAQALQSGYITGYEDGTFRPDAPITRAEMAVMVARALGLPLQANVSTEYADDRDVPVWAKASVTAMKKSGYMGGKGLNQFDPNVMTTRAEAVSVLLKVLNTM
ncbi:hypothetical protein D3P09_17705 [Paenibacillus pinisoli]|uniref:SLH domain-containing protein n=1 Tax=Paenibacillus pinisoli TaxID=1276110 RepID=A0A3A6PD19_9BACL|nr:S-layer homology domain-containing protein [Paenibacillus pinisoli]RJX37920.1 hypothetical protein D3P09_17705 [Paenibacillus pinisoli]